MTGHPPDDHAVELAVGTLLRSGVMLAAAVTAVGGIILVWQDGATIPTLGRFVGEPGTHTELPAIVRAAFGGDGAAIVQLGVLLLIATPIARVAFTLVAFVRQRDHFYTLVTAIVLGILAYSLFAGKVG